MQKAMSDNTSPLAQTANIPCKVVQISVTPIAATIYVDQLGGFIFACKQNLVFCISVPRQKVFTINNDYKYDGYRYSGDSERFHHCDGRRGVATPCDVGDGVGYPVVEETSRQHSANSARKKERNMGMCRIIYR